MQDTLRLVSETRTKNDRAQFITQETVSDNILCDAVSITRTEWDGAQQRGYDAEIRLDIFFADYSGQRICEFRGERFEIYRHFQSGERMELYLGRRVGV